MCWKGVVIDSQLRKEGEPERRIWGIAQNTLLRFINRKLTVKSRQNPFVCGRGTRSNESYIVDEKLLTRKAWRGNKRRSGPWEQRWNPSPEVWEKVWQCRSRRRKIGVKLLMGCCQVGSFVCSLNILEKKKGEAEEDLDY